MLHTVSLFLLYRLFGLMSLNEVLRNRLSRGKIERRHSRETYRDRGPTEQSTE